MLMTGNFQLTTKPAIHGKGILPSSLREKLILSAYQKREHSSVPAAQKTTSRNFWNLLGLQTKFSKIWEMNISKESPPTGR